MQSENTAGQKKVCPGNHSSAKVGAAAIAVSDSGKSTSATKDAGT